jgi:nucleotide-binding universal stress UspA family protein
MEVAMFKHILIPTDGSELSDLAVTKGSHFASEIGAKVTLFFAKPGFPVAYFGEGALIDPITPSQFAEMADQQAGKVLQAAVLVCAKAGVTCDTATETSDVPYEAIIEVAQKRGCDLIFMASHGRRGISGLLLGSETNKVLTHSQIPVLVYR